MDLNQPATGDNIDNTTWEHINEWAKKYLPTPSADAFSDWINEELGDWGHEGITVHQALTGAWQEWTGHDYPNP